MARNKLVIYQYKYFNGSLSDHAWVLFRISHVNHN